MYCLRCGTQNNNDARFCRYCRERLDNSHYDQARYSYNYSQTGDSKSTYSKPMEHGEYYNYSYKYSNNGATPTPQANNHQDQYSYSYSYSNNEIISREERYIANYIGKNYKNIKNSKFSLPTLIFGPLHFLYRKLYYYAFLWIAALVIIGYYLPEYFEVIYWCINLFIATKFTNIYLEKVEQQVDKIKHESLELTTTELLDKCTKEGRILKSLPKLLFRLIFIFIVIGIIYTLYTGYNEYIVETTKEEIIQADTMYDLNYQIPEGFQTSYSSTNTKTYYYENTDTYCRIGLHINKYASAYESDEEFLKFNVTLDNYPQIVYSTINSTPWAYMLYQPSIEQYHYYAHVYNNKGYLINFDLVQDSTGECSQKYIEFINSLKFN